MILLQANNISKNYVNHKALDDVSISVPQGAIYGLLGPNGAGKTTLIRIITRITMPDSGEVIFDGHPLDIKDIASIGYLPEERGLYKKMKVGEQALFLSRLKGLSRHEAMRRLRPWFEKFEIMGWWDKKVEELSKGMAQKIQFIVTVVHQPKLLIFDEPFSGFDPINANLLKNEIKAMKNSGATVIFSTHNMSSVEEICDHITLINKSKNILSGDVDSIRKSYGSGIYRLNFTGDELALRSKLTMCNVSSVEFESDRNKLVNIVLNNAPIRDVISVINESVDIHSFSEIIPSMNDIFINVVEGQSKQETI